MEWSMQYFMPIHKCSNKVGGRSLIPERLLLANTVEKLQADVGDSCGHSLS
jgi:hypothetical protein